MTSTRFISEIYIKFWTISKKDEPHSLCIYEIKDWQIFG